MLDAAAIAKIEMASSYDGIALDVQRSDSNLGRSLPEELESGFDTRGTVPAESHVAAGGHGGRDALRD